MLAITTGWPSSSGSVSFCWGWEVMRVPLAGLELRESGDRGRGLRPDPGCEPWWPWGWEAAAPPRGSCSGGRWPTEEALMRAATLLPRWLLGCCCCGCGVAPLMELLVLLPAMIPASLPEALVAPNPSPSPPRLSNPARVVRARGVAGLAPKEFEYALNVGGSTGGSVRRSKPFSRSAAFSA